MDSRWGYKPHLRAGPMPSSRWTSAKWTHWRFWRVFVLTDFLLTYYGFGFYFYKFPMCVFPALFFLDSWFFCLFFRIWVCLFLLSFHHHCYITLDTHLCSNEREKGCGFGCMGKCSGPKRRWGRVNHNQNILYERESIANRRRKRRDQKDSRSRWSKGKTTLQTANI